MTNGFGSVDDLLKGGASDAGSLKITPEEAEEKFSEKMREIKLKEKEKEAMAQAAVLGLSYINLTGFPIGPDTLMVLPEEQAAEAKVIPFYRSREEIRIGAVNPTDSRVQEIAFKIKEEFFADVMIYLISEHSFESAIKLYKAVPKIKEIIKGVEITQADLEKYKSAVTMITDLSEKIKGVSVTEVVTAMVALALQVDASDIHIEAEEADVKVRYRVDGILNDAAVLPKKDWPKITNRIKLLSSLKLNIENKPQDGRFTIFLEKDKVDVRVSVIPTTYGESIVMRLLRSAAVGLKFEDLGIRGRPFVDIENEIKKPNGMIITTGPTGSGKTTTLYAILTKLNNPATKIITLEDPVEYKLEGINQSQVDRSKGYTFAEGLRSILRQDPDVVMVGEIRDFETADVAINAALTGHLVISTLHTNSAAAAIPRFLAMGVKPFLLAPSLNAIVGQRLVRKICQACKEEFPLDTKTRGQVLEILSKIPPETAAQILPSELQNLKFYHGKGCPECHGIGFKGRIGIYEILIMTKEIEDLILSGQVSEYKMQDVAVARGMVTMIQDGLLKAADGITTVEEVFRVAKTL